MDVLEDDIGCDAIDVTYPHARQSKVICPTFTMSSSMCVVETSSAGREYKVRDMAQADFGYV